MKVCHVCGHGDQRAIKECLALKHAGHEVYLLTKAANAYMNYFDRAVFFDDDPSLIRAIKGTEADVYHVHCKPASIPKLAIEAFLEMGVPFVYDVHDLDLTRFERTNAEELFALMRSRFLIYPDPAIKELAGKLLFNAMPEAMRPRSLSLLPYFSLADEVYPLIQPNPFAVKDRVRKIVYEGNIIPPHIENIEMFPYYDLRFTAHIFHSYGYEMHIYPVGIDFNAARSFYDTSHAILHAPVEYPTLVREMSSFGWGFFGSFERSPQADNTFANKIMDYICAGIPVAVMNAERMALFLEETGFGVAIRNFPDDLIRLKEDVDRWEQIQQTILTSRAKWSMEARIAPLVKFYEEAIAEKCGGKIAPVNPCQRSGPELIPPFWQGRRTEDADNPLSAERARENPEEEPSVDR